MKERKITVRFAAEADLEQVNVIRRQIHELHHGGRPDFFKADGWEVIKDTVKERIASESSSVVVALYENEIAGIAILQYLHQLESEFRPARHFCHIEEFGVDEKYRRCGIASALIDFIKEDAKNRGLEKVELDVYEFNENALAFYGSAGFQAYRRYLELFP